MAKRVVFTKRFSQHLKSICDYIALESPKNALTWLERLESKLERIGEFPEAHPLARENADHKIELRQMMFGKGRNKYRVIFTVKENDVVVLDIRHGTRKNHPPESLD